jgi:4-alpha-glucanotransferase
MRFPRSSGVLLHPTSLPAKYGIGDLGPQAYRFVDFLSQTGQLWWQVLPLGPTGGMNSPYQSHSSFAGNPLLISPDALIEQGWLNKADLPARPDFPRERVDFVAVRQFKSACLNRAFERFHQDRKSVV